jgi:elongation factor Ts
MAEVTAAMVKQLRDKTDAPMMECKKALAEAAGDLDKAEEILRVKLGNKATRAASRVAAEGVVSVQITADGRKGAILELNCETDFVAKNPEFLALAAAAANLVIARAPADVAALSALPLGEGTVETVRAALVGKMGENMSLRRFVRVEAQGALTSYVHGGAKIGVMVDVSGGTPELAKDIAMHVAATKPRALRPDGVAAAEVERERSIAQQKAAESGKPAEIMTKMVDGAVQKYLKEVTLLSQPFVKDDKTTIEQLLKKAGATINGFVLFLVGEGIEKKQVDFAAEVAAQAAAARG